MILTLKELANYLRVNERTILRMQQTGQIQGIKIGGQWRFNGSQIDSIFFPDGHVNPSDAVSLGDITHSHLAIPVSRIIRRDRMVLKMTADSIESAVGELCRVVRQSHLLLDVKDLEQRVLKREELLSTGVGNGIAIPHARDPLPTLSELSAIIVGRSEKGIAFNAIDNQPVHLFFLLCSQTIEMHLHMMGRLARLLRHAEITAKLRQADTSEEFLRVIMEAERIDFLEPVK